MAKALIVFGSTTGNTETVARQIGEILAQQDLEVTVKNVAKTRVEEMENGFDVVLLGASTWGDDDMIEFQEDFTPFYNDMGKADLTDKKIALFGCGDSSYEYFCGAVDLLQEKVGDLGGVLVNEPLRIDGDPQDAVDEIANWAMEVADGV